MQRVVGVCAGAPDNDETWLGVHQRAAEILESARPKLSFDKKEKKHRRGKFPAIAIGISHGGGQPYPMILDQDPRNELILEELMRDKAFERISGFATGEPRLFSYKKPSEGQICW
jgi:hypothetical protein